MPRSGPAPRPAARDAMLAGLREVWPTGGRKFVTFELLGDDGRGDPDVWIQWLDGELNLAWPFDEDPADELPRRGAPPPRGASVSSWQPGSNAILGAWDARDHDVADFCDRVFVRVFGARAGYAVEVRVDAHG
ncbi:MAG: hypothetical protein HMLKMBBP_01398 [Planctomycetes bacterium]|nr:hypothetical protein [Planctomycetota bacterium]